MAGLLHDARCAPQKPYRSPDWAWSTHGSTQDVKNVQRGEKPAVIHAFHVFHVYHVPSSGRTIAMGVYLDIAKEVEARRPDGPQEKPAVVMQAPPSVSSHPARMPCSHARIGVRAHGTRVCLS